MSGRMGTNFHLWIGMLNIREAGDRDLRWMDSRPITFANWWFGEQSAPDRSQ